MKVHRLSVVFLMVITSGATYASECDISFPESIDLPEWTQDSPEGFIWVGTAELAARVPKDGRWTAMGSQYNYRDKWVWWRDGFQALDESQPELSITARKLDGPAPMVVISDATSALGDPDAMLMMMEFPTAGCWEVLGEYHDHELRFVFEVGNAD